MAFYHFCGYPSITNPPACVDLAESLKAKKYAENKGEWTYRLAAGSGGGREDSVAHCIDRVHPL